MSLKIILIESLHLLSVLQLAGEVENLILVAKDHRDLVIIVIVIMININCGGGRLLQRDRVTCGQDVLFEEVLDVNLRSQVIDQQQDRMDDYAESENHQNGDESSFRFAPIEDEVNVAIPLAVRNNSED